MNKRSIIRISLICSLIILFCLPLVFRGPYVLHICILLLMNIVLATSLRLINLTGNLSLAHGGAATIGAYTSALLVIKLGISSWAALVLAGIAAALVAALVGFPFVRLKGIYFTMVTVFLGQIVTYLIQQWKGVTGGISGIFNIPQPDSINILNIIHIVFDNRSSLYYLILVLTLISLLLLYLIEHSRVGFIFRGIQQADSLAESVGIYTRGYKVLAFSLGCFFAGFIGGFYSQYVSTIQPNTFGFIYTVYTATYMVIGGSASFYGPILGAIVMFLLPEIMRPLKTYQPFFFAFALILIIFFMPKGLVQLPELIKQKTIRFSQNRKRYARN
jgi:branched-chain amino acid transport system permease protein